MNSVTTTEVVCSQCAIRFAVDENLMELRKKDGANFFCPNGHLLKYTNSYVDQLAAAKTALDEAQNEVRDLKIELTRLKCELVKTQQQRGVIARLFKV